MRVRQDRSFIFFVIPVSLFIAAVFWTIQPHEQRHNADDIVSQAPDVLKLVQTTDSLHFAADVRVHLVTSSDGSPLPGNGDFGAGRFEYWSDENRYCIISEIDLPELDSNNVLIAFDGETHRTLRADRGLLVKQAGTPDSLGMMLPHPLWQLVQHLIPLTDSDWHLGFTPQRIGQLTVQDAQAIVQWMSPLDSSGPWIAEYGGGSLDSEPYVHHVEFSQINGQFLPTRITRLTASRIITETLFDDFEQYGEGSHQLFYPHSVVMRSFGLDGGIMAEIFYTVTALERARPVDQGVFTIAPILAERIYDKDTGEFDQ